MPSLIATLGLEASAFQAGLNHAASAAQHAGHEIGEHLGEHLTGALAGAASVGAMEEIIHRTVEYGEHVSDLSQRLGISTDAVQAWDYALKLNGSTIDSAAGFFEKLGAARTKALRGGDEQIQSFKKLGVSIEDLKNQRIEDIGKRIAEAFESGDPQKLIGDLKRVGGKGAGEMVAAFRAGFAELLDEARSAGTIIDANVIDKLKEFGDSSKRIGAQFLAGIAPALATVGNLLEKAWQGWNAGMRVAVGFATGGVQGAKDLLKEYQDQIRETEKAAEARAEKRREPLTGGGDEEESKHERQEEIRHAEKILRLKEELVKLQEQNDLRELSKQEQIQELLRRRKEIIESADESEQGQLEAQVEAAKIDSQLQNLRKVKAEPDRDVKRPDVNSLQKIGAFASPVDNALLTAAQRSERHLARLVELTTYGNAGNPDEGY